MLRSKFWIKGVKDGPRKYIRTTVRDTPLDHCFRLGIDSHLTGTVDLNDFGVSISLSG